MTNHSLDPPPNAKLDAVSRFTTQHGFSAVIALILLWFILGKFQSTMTNIANKINENGIMAAELLRSQQALLDQCSRDTRATP